MNTYRFLQGMLDKPSARRLAAELLAFAGPERPKVLQLSDVDGDRTTLEVSGGSVKTSTVIIGGRGDRKIRLQPTQIDALIAWLQGHREDNPS